MIPGSPEWNRLVTASKVAAILGVSPWESPRSVWHTMRGELDRGEQTEAMSRGHYLEPAILAWWRDQHPECAAWTNQPEFTLGDWAAATPDMSAHMSPNGCDPLHENICTEVLVEAKSVADDSEWGDPGSDVIPPYYLCQVYWQMHVSGIHKCFVPIITGRLRFAEYVVDYDAAIGADLERRVRAFYDSLASDVPPDLDDSVATFNAVRKLHPDIDPDLSVECDPDEAVEFIEAMNEANAADRHARFVKARAFDQMGRARYLTANGIRVARRQPNKTGISLVQVAKDASLITPKGDAA